MYLTTSPSTSKKITAAIPVTAGGSFTSVTVMVTMIVSLFSSIGSAAWGMPAGSVALTVTV